MKQTDIKTIYPTFKFFKDYYSILNRADEVYLFGSTDSSFDIYFSQDSQYYLLSGTIWEKNIFTEWLYCKTATLKYDDVVLLHKCLKKNVISIDFDDNEFILEYTDKEGNTIKTTVSVSTPDYNKTITAVDLMYHSADIDRKNIDVEILSVFEKENEIVFKHQDGYDKLIEYPAKKFLSHQKDGTYFITYSDRLESGIRFVGINTSTEKITLKQIFATI